MPIITSIFGFLFHPFHRTFYLRVYLFGSILSPFCHCIITVLNADFSMTTKASGSTVSRSEAAADSGNCVYFNRPHHLFVLGFVAQSFDVTRFYQVRLGGSTQYGFEARR